MSRSPPPIYLSAEAELLHRMLQDTTHVARETRDLVIGLHVQMQEQRTDHGHLSQQVAGLTSRMWRQEEHMRDVKRQISQKKEPASWDIFSRRELVILAALGLASILGLLDGPAAKHAILKLVGIN